MKDEFIMKKKFILLLLISLGLGSFSNLLGLSSQQALVVAIFSGKHRQVQDLVVIHQGKAGGAVGFQAAAKNKGRL